VGKYIILSFIKKHKSKYIIGTLFMILTSFIKTLLPRVLGDAVDILKVEGFNPQEVMLRVRYILAITIISFITTYIWRHYIITSARNLECYLREKLYEHLQKLSPEFYNKRKTGDLLAYAINDISAVRMTFGPAIARSIDGIALSLISIYLMAQSVNPTLTLISLIPIPILIVFIFKTGTILRLRFKKVQECFAAISDRVQENIYGIRVIKAFVQEDEEVKNFEKLNDEMVEANVRMVRVSSILTPIIDIAFGISLTVTMILGGRMVLDGNISLGDFVAFNTYLIMIKAPVVSTSRIVNILQRGIASLGRLNEIFNTEPQIKDGEANITTPVQGEIKIKNLSFTYPGAQRKSLVDINIKIPKGHTLGIVGKTGSGKSTIANLLLKLYNAEPATIFIDNIDINNYQLQTLRNGFGYVPQDSFLFSASIKDNITFFKDIYSDNEIKAATENSRIYETIMSYPEGFNAILGERGINLSGGQKQRVAIARAIIKNPAVLILDDALSAVDTITEEQILENLKSIRKGRTTIIIAHRLSAVKHADEIIVMDNGHIAEQGTYDELLKKKGIFHDIYVEQIAQAQ
jgi:ATP-binding cassette subfamily B multidrug efflux pump